MVNALRAPGELLALVVTIWVVDDVDFLGLVTELVTGGLRRRDGKAGGL